MTQDQLNPIIDNFYRQKIAAAKQHLSKIYNLQNCPFDDPDVARILNSNSLSKYFSDFSCWKIDISCVLGNGSLIIFIPARYPDNFPRLYLDSELLKKIYPVPHIDKNGFICTRDPVVVVINDDKPGEALEELIKIALEIIDSGVKKENEQEYFDELIAYWDENATCSLLSNITNQDSWKILTVYSLDRTLYTSDRIVSDLVQSDLNSWLAQFTISIKVKEKGGVLFVPVKQDLPLNLITIKDAYGYLTRSVESSVIKKINEYYSIKQSLYTVICSMPSKEGRMLFGWWHIGWDHMRINGFRRGHVPFKVILGDSNFSRKEIRRMKVLRLDATRLNARII